MPEPQETTDETTDGRNPRRPGRFVVTVILVAILLLLLSTCTVSTAIYYRIGPQTARFVIRNAACLQCHTEVLAEMRKPVQHQPFIQRDCLACHEEHTNIARVTVTSSDTTTRLKTSTWFRWGPFRNLVESLQRTLFGVSKQTQVTYETRALGPAKLTEPIDQLCWLCHGNLGPKRHVAFQHQPFAANHCIDCHNPHASNHASLLTADPTYLCVTCHPMGQELNRKQAHPPALQRDCLACHDPHASEYPGVLTAGQRDLCFTCHPSVAVLSNDAVQHQPFLGDNCTGCHEPHGSDYPPLLITATPDLCYTCHTTLEARFSRVSHHPVGTTMDCSSCHQPHASPYTSLLLQPQPTLCISCHTDIAGLMTLSVQHAPFADECTGCHTPHGSDFKPLLKNPVPNLCYMCHPRIATTMSRPSHHPTECTRCHNVHASQHRFLLFADLNNNFCYHCHPPIEKPFTTSKHAGLNCLKCHNAHGSKYKPLLAKYPPKVCTQCHSEHKYVGNGVMFLLKVPPDLIATWGPTRNVHRVTPRFFDAHSKKPLTCTSTCHNPHGSPYEHMTRNYAPQLDGLCLQCHKGVGLRF